MAHSGKKIDFYTALYLGNYNGDTVTFECDDEVPEDYFDGFIPGDKPENEKGLYPQLYRESTRQQFHFSPRCGWMNDPNGLFWKDGKFNLYFQHNPFGSRHGGVNVSWGHAVSEDGVHFTEYPDAIMPYNSKCSVASGSCYVDTGNLCGKGEGTVLAAYTALQARQYRGRAPVTQNDGQMLLYSLDNGMTFHMFEKNPIIPVPDGEEWRDPKILEVNGEMIAIVYEPLGNEKRTSFYASHDGSDWKRISSGEKFHECPDFFEMEVYGSNEKLYVMYGGFGRYSIGTFENFRFSPIEQDFYLDYGENTYAGQTFGNYPSKQFRYHIAWLRDSDLRCFIADDYVFKGIGFNQSMSVMCKLRLCKTELGYRVFRTPHENLEKLRYDGMDTELTESNMLDVPAEYLFTLEEKTLTFEINDQGFTWNPTDRSISTSTGKKYHFSSSGNLAVRLFADRRSVEFFIGEEISISYFAIPETQEFKLSGSEKIPARRYRLHSIWN